MIRRPLLILATALAVVLPAGAGAAVLPADTTAVLSGQPDLLSLLPAPAGPSRIADRQALSADGTKVVFTSASDGLVADDDDNVSNVYVEDLATGAVQLISRRSGASGEPAHGDCDSAAISADGNAVAFVCEGSLDDADPVSSFRAQVYLRDLVHEDTTLVSRANGLAGDVASSASGGPAISADGAFVAFGTHSPNLGVNGDAVYRRDVHAGVTAVAGIGSPQVFNDRGATNPSISGDGRFVAFQTDTSFSPADTNTRSDVYVRDFANGGLQLASRQSGNGAGENGDGAFGAIVSGDGGTVVFHTDATNLSPADSTAFNDNLYAHSLVTGATVLVGFDGSGAKIDDAFLRGVSADGSVIAFTKGGDAFLWGGAAHPAADRVSVADGPAGGALGGVTNAAVDPSGAVVAIGVDHGITGDLSPELPSVVVRDTRNATTRTVSRPAGGAPFVNAGGDGFGASLSADGRYAAFASSAPAFGVPQGPSFALSGQTQVFRRDLETGEVTLVSREDGLDGAPLTSVAVAIPQISGDGRRVAFAIFDRAASAFHAYVRDVASGRTFPVDVADGTGAVGTGSVDRLSISDDGSRVAFLTGSALVSDDADGGNPDVYVRDLARGQTLLVDRAAGERGAPAEFAARPRISGDGHSVVFDTSASLVAHGDGDQSDDVYVRDLDRFTTTLASVAGEAAKGDRPSRAAGISRDGSRVLLLSQATNFDPAPPNLKLYVRDIRAQSLTVAARADGTGGAPVADLPDPSSSFTGAAISADGQHVTFAAFSNTSIAPGDPGDDDVQRTYERDLASGVTRLIARRSGATGAPQDELGFAGRGTVAMTADGGCVAFPGTGTLLTPPASADHRYVLLRVVRANCGRAVTQQPPDDGGPGTPKPAVLSRLSVKPARFHVGGRKGGTRIAFRLDKGASVTLAFDRLLAGHRKGKRCLTTVRRGRKCTVVRRVAGHVTVSRTHAGANTVKFSGKLGRRALVPGSYRLTATPSHGRAVTVHFVVVKAPKPKPRRGGPRR